MRRDRRAYFADQALQDEYRALLQAEAAPEREVAAGADTAKFTRDVRRYMRTNRDDYFRDEHLQSTYRAVLAHDAAQAEQADAPNVTSEPAAD
jgi:hypothetical protein